MNKPLQDVRFFLIDGIWRDARGLVLADFLADYEIIVDDRCQFARLYDYERMIEIWYRAHSGRVDIRIWRITKQ